MIELRSFFLAGAQFRSRLTQPPKYRNGLEEGVVLTLMGTEWAWPGVESREN